MSETMNEKSLLKHWNFNLQDLKVYEERHRRHVQSGFL